VAAAEDRADGGSVVDRAVRQRHRGLLHMDGRQPRWQRRVGVTFRFM